MKLLSAGGETERFDISQKYALLLYIPRSTAARYHGATPAQPFYMVFPKPTSSVSEYFSIWSKKNSALDEDAHGLFLKYDECRYKQLCVYGRLKNLKGK